jgi:hypothetical protein
VILSPFTANSPTSWTSGAYRIELHQVIGQSVAVWFKDGRQRGACRHSVPMQAVDEAVRQAMKDMGGVNAK